MQQYKKDFIEFMVASGVLTFGEFKTKSGRLTPYFINTGNYNTGAQLARLGEFYASALQEHFTNSFDVLYGPAYKGIPLAVTTASTLASKFNKDIKFCFNRKEEKDHGEGGSLIGYKPKPGDRVIIIEDVTTAGTSVRETVTILSKFENVKIEGLIVSVDRMEKGQSTKSALQELKQEFSINAVAIVTLNDIISHLHNRELNGKVYIDDNMMEKIKKYRELYGCE